MFGNSFRAFSFKKAFYGLVLGGLLFLGGSSPASAADGPYCGRRIIRERVELHGDAVRHGFYSRQANFDRRQLARLRYERAYPNRWR